MDQDRENAKNKLLLALLSYFAWAKEYNLDDSEQFKDFQDVLDEAGKEWDIVTFL